MDATMLANLLNSSMTGLDWAIIALYFVVIIVIGVLASRKGDDDQGYFLGGRRMPGWAVAMSFAATALSAATFIGGPEYAYGKNLTLLAYEIGKILGALLVLALLLPPLYRSGCLTVYGYLGQRIGPGAATAASVMFLVGRVLASGARLFIAGTAFSLILYGNLEPTNLVFAIILFGVVGTLYTALGGIRAVIWTDTLQLVVVVGALLISMVLLLQAIPLPLSEIAGELNRDNKLVVFDPAFDLTRGDTLWAALAMTFFYAAAFGTDHDMAQRLLTCKSLKQSVNALIGATLIALPITVLFMLTGLLLYVFYARPDLMGDAAPAQTISDARKVYPQYLLNELPIGVRGLAMAGLFAAAMSSLDSAINAMASTAIADVVKPIRNRMGGQAVIQDEANNASGSRLMVVAMGALLTCAAIGMVLMYDKESDTLITFALSVMTFAYAGLLGVFGAVLLTGRGSTASVIAALVTGAAVIAASRYMPGIKELGLAFPYWMILATLAGFLVCLLGANKRATGL